MGTKIIFAICFLPVAFLMFGILYFEGIRKGRILLGVTLWPGAEEEAQVQKVRRQYRHEMWGLLWGSLGLFAVSCIPRQSVAFSLQLLWLLLVMTVFFVPHVTGNRRLKEIKREWMACQEPDQNEQGSQCVRVDVRASAQAQPRPFWKGGFAGVVLGFVPVAAEPFLAENSFYGWWSEVLLLILALSGLAIFWLMWNSWLMRTDLVSLHSEVNQQVARVRQYQWGRFWCMAVWENSILLFALWYGMHRPYQLFWIVIVGVLLMILTLLVQLIFTERNISRAYETYADPAYWRDSEDQYWLGGIFYYNKKDKRFMVNKRVGIGTTVNLAKTSGKVFMAVTGVVTVGLILWTAILLPAYDFVPVSLEVSEGCVVSRQFGEEYRIPLEDVEQAELVTELPSMSKRVGTAMDTIYKGSFMAKDYSSCKVCVRLLKPPFLKLVSKEGMTYYLNDEEEGQTREVFRLLAP